MALPNFVIEDRESNLTLEVQTPSNISRPTDSLNLKGNNTKGK